MMETEMLELGTDIDTSWTFNEQGDLKLISNDENIKQTILNRLNCNINQLDIYYEEYGSLLQNMLGAKLSEENLEFIRIEIETSLAQDPRFSNDNFDVTVENKNSTVNININIWYGEEEMEFNLIINEDNEIEEETEDGSE